jgi:hypothetical protein
MLVNLICDQFVWLVGGGQETKPLDFDGCDGGILLIVVVVEYMAWLWWFCFWNVRFIAVVMPNFC